MVSQQSPALEGRYDACDDEGNGRWVGVGADFDNKNVAMAMGNSGRLWQWKKKRAAAFFTRGPLGVERLRLE